MFDKVAIVGDLDLIFPFRALGIKVHSPKDLDEARNIIETLEQGNIALCFLHEKFFEPLAVERESLVKKLCPVVVGFSDYRQIVDYLGKRMKEMSLRATGSDSLVKRKGKDETR